MRLKSFPRRVDLNSRQSCIVKNGEKCLEILNVRNESFLDLKNLNGLDLSTKKKVLFLRPSCTLQLRKVKRKVCTLFSHFKNNALYNFYLKWIRWFATVRKCKQKFSFINSMFFYSVYFQQIVCLISVKIQIQIWK